MPQCREKEQPSNNLTMTKLREYTEYSELVIFQRRLFRSRM